jgi:hypothetical protein
MNNVVEIEIGIDHKGNADMFDPDSDPDTDSDPEETFYSARLSLPTL